MIKRRNTAHRSNPKPDENSICIKCGAPFSEAHEIFHGSNRNLSIQFGLQVHLCPEHHRGTTGVHGRDGHELDEQLRVMGQVMFEAHHGTRQDFRRIFGRNYLEADDVQGVY